jgi:hypothetical protein
MHCRKGTPEESGEVMGVFHKLSRNVYNRASKSLKKKGVMR